MAKTRVLVILNEGRYAMLAGQLDRLKREGIIEDWTGMSLCPLEKLGSPQARAGQRLHFIGDAAARFSTYAEASAYAEKMALEYPGIHFGRIYAAEKYPGRQYPGGLPDLMDFFSALRDLIEREGLNAVFSDYPASSADLMAYYLILAAGGRPFYFTQSRVGEKLLRIDSLERPNSEVNGLYREYSGRALTVAENERARAFLDDFMQRKSKPVYYQNQSRRRGRWERMRAALGALSTHPVSWARGWWIRRRAAVARKAVPFRLLDPRDKIVFFPIQYVPEASVYVRAPLLRDQVALVSMLAQSLPAGYTLYVKDHPLLKDRRNASYYESILQLPNVKLLDYGVDTHDVLRAAKLTVTLSGTPGLESIFYGVPVVLLGGADTGYQDFQGVVKSGGHSLESLINRALRVTIRAADRRCAALAFLDAGSPGRFNDPRWDASILSDENRENLYDFFSAGFRKMSREEEASPGYRELARNTSDTPHAQRGA